MLNFFDREQLEKTNRHIQQQAHTMSIQTSGLENKQNGVLENDVIDTDQYFQLDNQQQIEQLDLPSFNDIPSTQYPSDFVVLQDGKNQQQIQSKIEQHSKKVQTFARKKRVLKIWDSNEDAQLLIQYEKHNGNWNKIIKYMPGRNVSQCSQRWRRLQPTKSFKRKQWTQEEDEKILELVKQFGKNWRLIALHFPNTLSKQIRERYINQIDPQINTGPWTETEDATLLRLYQDYGGKWSFISSHLKGRPENMVKNRFYCYIRRVHLGVQNPHQIVYQENCDSAQEDSNELFRFE